MRGHTVIIDANLLVLWVVGLTDRRYIDIHKKLKAYRQQDFELLVGLLQQSKGILLTPNTLTEASNLARQINDPAKREIGQSFRAIIAQCEEFYRPSKDAADRPEFIYLGLADTVQLELGDASTVLLTTDAALCEAAGRRGQRAVNFHHLRGLED